MSGETGNCRRAPTAPGSREPSPAVSALTGFDPSRVANYDETDWHVLAQDIANYWQHPNERAIAYQAAAEAIKLLRGREQPQGDVCSDCGGYGEYFGHADDCDSDSCALNGDMDSCNGQVFECHCAQGMSTRSAETEGLSPQDASPVRDSECAQGEAPATLAEGRE